MRTKNIHLTILLLSILVIFQAVHSGAVDSANAVFRKVSGDGFGSTVLGPTFSASNLLKCAAKCLTRYLSLCKSIIYNQALQSCIPGGSIFTTLTSRPPGTLYSTNTDCRDTNGLIITLFELLIYGKSGTCQNIGGK